MTDFWEFLKFVFPALFSCVYWRASYYSYKYVSTGDQKWQDKLKNIV